MGEGCNAGWRVPWMPGEGEACSTDELPLRVLSLESGHCINIIRFNQAVGNASFSLCLFFFPCSSCGRRLPASREVSSCFLIVQECRPPTRLLSLPRVSQKHRPGVGISQKGCGKSRFISNKLQFLI